MAAARRGRAPVRPPHLALHLGAPAARLVLVPAANVVAGVRVERQVDQARAQVGVLLEHLLHAARARRGSWAGPARPRGAPRNVARKALGRAWS